MFISPKEFGTLSGVPLETVRKWLRNKILRGTRMGRRWLIPKTEVERLLLKENLTQGNTPAVTLSEDSDTDTENIEESTPSTPRKTLKEVLAKEPEREKTLDEELEDEECDGLDGMGNPIEEKLPTYDLEQVNMYMMRMFPGQLQQLKKEHKQWHDTTYGKDHSEEVINRDFIYRMAIRAGLAEEEV